MINSFFNELMTLTSKQKEALLLKNGTETQWRFRQ